MVPVLFLRMDGCAVDIVVQRNTDVIQQLSNQGKQSSAGPAHKQLAQRIK